LFLHTALRQHIGNFDPDSRERYIAIGCLTEVSRLPRSLYLQKMYPDLPVYSGLTHSAPAALLSFHLFAYSYLFAAHAPSIDIHVRKLLLCFFPCLCAVSRQARCRPVGSRVRGGLVKSPASHPRKGRRWPEPAGHSGANRRRVGRDDAPDGSETSGGRQGNGCL
jgi:hypothetical protein